MRWSGDVRVFRCIFFFFLSVTFLSVQPSCKAIVGAEALTPTSHHLMLGDWRLILEAMHFLLLLQVTHAPYIYVNCSQRSIHARGVVFVCFFSLVFFFFHFQVCCPYFVCCSFAYFSLLACQFRPFWIREMCFYFIYVWRLCVWFWLGVQCLHRLIKHNAAKEKWPREERTEREKEKRSENAS